MAGVAFWLFRGQASEYTILGVHGVGLIFTAVTGNLRHSHVWMRFPEPVERWLMSPLSTNHPQYGRAPLRHKLRHLAIGLGPCTQVAQHQP